MDLPSKCYKICSPSDRLTKTFCTEGVWNSTGVAKRVNHTPPVANLRGGGYLKIFEVLCVTNVFKSMVCETDFLTRNWATKFFKNMSRETDLLTYSWSTKVFKSMVCEIDFLTWNFVPSPSRDLWHSFHRGCMNIIWNCPSFESI